MPEQPHTLEVSYVFPDRARWRIAPEAKTEPGREREDVGEARRDSRRLRFRWGTGVWEIAPGELSSRRFLDAELRLALLQVELRRIALIWPAELQWAGEGEQRAATLPTLGTLHVVLDPGTGRPTRLESRDFDGTLRERLDKIAWRSEGQQFWPTHWDLVVNDELIWHESFESVRTGAKFLDDYFLPGDVREEDSSAFARVDKLETIVVKPFASTRVVLPAEVQGNWEKSIALGVAEIQRWQREFAGTDRVVDERPHFFVDENCQPSALEIRLKAGWQVCPEGWEVRLGHDAIRVVRTGVAGLSAPLLAKLRARVPESRLAGPAYVALQIAEVGPGITQVFLPTLSRP